VDDPSAIFPRAKASEKTSVQPFFIEIMAKFLALCNGKKMVYRAGADGKYNVATKLGDVTCMPDASVHDTPTIGSRKPDVNIYYQTVDTKGILRIVSLATWRSSTLTKSSVRVRTLLCFKCLKSTKIPAF
jgi:hypothetical protein